MSAPAALVGLATSGWAVRMATWGLWGLVAFSGIAGGAALAMTMSRPGQAAAPVPVDEPAGSVGAEGFAELFVAAWLAAGEDHEEAVGGFTSRRVTLSGVESGRLWAARTAAVAASKQAEGYWSVVVAAEVLAADDSGGYRPAGLRYYAVGVASRDGGLVVADLPAQVPPPAALPPPQLAVDRLELPGGELGPVAEAVRGFVAALLTGQGDLDRYVAPTAAIAAIDPPPFSEVRVERVGARPYDHPAGVYLVRAAVVGTDGGGRTQRLAYSLDMVQRDGRWEVVELLPAAPLNPAGNDRRQGEMGSGP